MNLLGLFLSYLLLVLLFIIALILPKYVNKEFTRKIIHIGISNWYFIVLYIFDNYIIALIAPITFTFLNYLSFRYNLVKGIERENKKDLGTIYYPLSLIILVIFSCLCLQKPYIGAIGTFILGYGDGLATITGKLWGKKKLYKRKTYIGSMTMFIVSFIIMIIILSVYQPNQIILLSFLVAIGATLLELFSSKGFDNLTVPIGSSLLYYILTLFK
ncbi:MAG TPA: hypothetical protein VIK84_03445 [Haloplasmataceae bacterium]